MITYRHSGTLGDLIYSLSVVKKMEPGRFMVAINNIENCVSQYGYRAEEVDPAHKGRFTTRDFELLAPLLERQSYIKETCTWHRGDTEPDIDLDLFRGVLFRGFEGNYVEAYHKTFGIPYKLPDVQQELWLEADPVTVAPIVVSRTPRYRRNSDEEYRAWMNYAKAGNLSEHGIFIGTEKEHADFQRDVNVYIRHYKVKDFLEMANVVAGASLVLANQNFVYSLAMGLGISTVLETIKIKPLQNNECFFLRENTLYF